MYNAQYIQFIHSFPAFHCIEEEWAPHYTISKSTLLNPNSFFFFFNSSSTFFTRKRIEAENNVNELNWY